MPQPLFISFEGGDGVGKTSQIELLADYLRSKYGYDIVTTREPGGCAEAEALRHLLLSRHDLAWLGSSEALLFYAARLEHVERIIKPALAAGKIVISDRFHDSTLAYQAVRSAQGIAWVKKLHRLVMQGFAPDVTLLMDMDCKIAQARLQARAQSNSQKADRLEQAPLAEKQRLRQAFLRLAKAEPQRIRIINADQSYEAVANDIRQQILAKLAMMART